MLRFIAIFIFFWHFGNCLAQIQESEVQIVTDSITLKGTMLVPTMEEKMPVALIISGSGPTDRNGNNPAMINNSLKMLAEGLSEKGIATIRYDKRGIGESKDERIKEEELILEDFAEDAKAWIDFVRNKNEFSSIFVIGHSEGALLASMVTKETELDGMISLAGIGRGIDEVVLEQIEKNAPNAKELTVNIFEKLKKGETIEEVPFFLHALFRPSVQPFLINFLEHSPVEEIAAVQVPVLIIQGDEDLQVKVLDAELLHQAQDKSELVILESMNHILKSVNSEEQNIQSYQNPEIPLHAELIPIIFSFIEKVNKQLIKN